MQTIVSHNRKPPKEKLLGSVALAGDLLKMKIVTEAEVETLGVGSSDLWCNKPFS